MLGHRINCRGQFHRWLNHIRPVVNASAHTDRAGNAYTLARVGFAGDAFTSANETMKRPTTHHGGPYEAWQPSVTSWPQWCLYLAILVFSVDIGRKKAGFAGPVEQATLTLRREPASPVTSTRRLMKRTTVTTRRRSYEACSRSGVYIYNNDNNAMLCNLSLLDGSSENGRFSPGVVITMYLFSYFSFHSLANATHT